MPHDGGKGVPDWCCLAYDFYDWTRAVVASICNFDEARTVLLQPGCVWPVAVGPLTSEKGLGDVLLKVEAKSEDGFLCEFSSMGSLGDGFTPVVCLVAEGGLPFGSIILEDAIPLSLFLITVTTGTFAKLCWGIVPVVFFFVFWSGKPVSVLEVDVAVIETIPCVLLGAC